MGHHFESDLAKAHPQLDLSDVYAFESDRPGFTAFVMCQNPQSKSVASEPSVDNLMDGGLSSFHIGYARDGSSGTTLTFLRQGPDIRIGRAPSATPPLGELGQEIGVLPPGESLFETEGVKAWVGTAKDPFAGNALGLRAFKHAIAHGAYEPESFDNAHNFFENLLTTAIVFELPNASLPPTIYYFGTSAWRDHGQWRQVNRIGHVLVPHLYLESADATLAHMANPVATDADRAAGMAAHIARHAALAGFQADPDAYGAEMAQRLLPDVVPYMPGTPAAYAVEATNGRALEDPAMDVALHWLVGGPLTAKVVPHDCSTRAFPYVVAA